MSFWGSLGKFFGSAGGAAIAGAGGNIVGGILQAHATNNAAKLQAQSTKEALDFAKQNHAEMQRDYAPYQQAGYGAVGNLQSFLASHRPPQGGPLMSQQPSLAQFAPQAGQAQMVTLRSPTGQVKQVPAQLAQHYISLGAQPMGQGA